MADRIKFGPEWLRNLAPGTSGSGNNNHTAAMSSSSTAGASGGASGGNASNPNAPNTSVSPTSKVLLAKLRYGREEMLALYNRTSDAPSELKYIDQLYQPRGKPPFALNNTFEDEMRENMRSGPPIGNVSLGERVTMGRGMGRGLNISDGRGRPRLPFLRQPSTGRGSSTVRHLGNPRMPGYSGGADDDSSLNLRSSWSGNNGGNMPNRNPNEQTEWTPSKMYRSKRQGQATNWRQSREEGEEWRAQDAGRSRGNNSQQDNKWERDWGDRPTQDKPPSWNSNRRTWVGGDTQNDENLPEWAVDNAEACGGTFDASGAFHGYSNDDTNLPKNQEYQYQITRSHTHGSFGRSGAIDESSDEWWAPEKAKKLSPKRFDASDVKFKKQTSAPESSDTSSDSKLGAAKEEQNDSWIGGGGGLDAMSMPAYQDQLEGSCDCLSDDIKFNKSFKPKFSESKTFDSLMRSDINLEDTTDDRGNFQSVMITPNNSLRQKHQNIVSVASDSPKDSSNGKPGSFQHMHNQGNPQMDNEMRKHQSPEEKIVDDIVDLALEDKEIHQKHPTSIPSPLINQSTSNISSPMSSIANTMPQLSNPAMQLRLSSPVFAIPGLMQVKPNMPPTMQGGLPAGMHGLPAGMQGLPAGLQGLPAGQQIAGLPPSLQVSGVQPMGMQGGNMQPSGIQGGNQAPGLPPMQSPGMQSNQMPSGMQAGMQQSMQGSPMQVPGLQGSGMPSSGLQGGVLQPNMQPGLQSLQSVGITNSALNASLGLPIRPGGNTIGLPIQGVPTPVMPNTSMGNPGMVGGQMQPGFPNAGVMPGISTANSSLFMTQNSNNPGMGSQGDIPMPNQHGQSNMFPMHSLQQGSQASYGSSIYSNIIQQAPNQPPAQPSSGDMWYYEDPEKNIQGPFSSKDMYSWYRAGFFSPSLMVRRACDTLMHPLGSYGPVVPFTQMDMMPPFPMSSGFDRSPGPHESMLNSQQALGIESVRNISHLNEVPVMNSMHIRQVSVVGNTPVVHQQQMVDSLWSPSSPSADMLWMQQAMSRNENRVNNLPLYFWDQQPSAIASNALLPEEIAKEMKTEDQILAQMRASQGIGAQNAQPMGEHASSAPSKLEESFPTPTSATPDMGELQKLIQKDTLTKTTETSPESSEAQSKPEKATKVEPVTESQKQQPQQQQEQQQQQQQEQQQQQQQQSKPAVDTKQAKQAKNENEKVAKNKENNASKNKNKKKDEKKEDLESKTKEDDIAKPEKRSDEPSPAKSKKEDKANKKELEKEKKEWLKDGFTIVKGSEKSNSKDNKKKAEEAKAVEEAERKRKEEEKLVAEEDKRRKQTEAAIRKQQETQQQQQRQAAESVVKKAPWSAANQGMFATNKDGLTLTEIQRLEREKKLEQIKEQQQMMQIIAQQQAAALAREQEMQAGLGWAKKKGTNANTTGQSLAEIQAEARKQAAAAAAAVAAAQAAQALDEAAQPVANHVPWGSAPNGDFRRPPGGFWDTQPNPPTKSAEKPQESPKVVEPKKKKPTVNVTHKKETSPAVEFESWCTSVLVSWSSKIDVPTFVGFLKDIESPYEVKDYVKCYLGETKDSSDFARQFLERRSKLLRVGMVTPSDDLCSPAMAVNPRTTSSSDYQEVKGKGKKTKKNKMLKVDARILGFSVTAAEDRINVGDIDTV